VDIFRLVPESAEFWLFFGLNLVICRPLTILKDQLLRSKRITIIEQVNELKIFTEKKIKSIFDDLKIIIHIICGHFKFCGHFKCIPF
jgi:hypothetical protein